MQLRQSRRAFLLHLLTTAGAAAFGGIASAQEWPEVVLLDIPYFSQRHWSAPNYRDCLQACAMMLQLKRLDVLGLDRSSLLTVDDLSRLWNAPVDEVTYLQQMFPLENIGFVGEYSEHATIDWQREQIRDGKPCIVLVDYEGFRPENRAVEYYGYHHVLMVGIDGNGVRIHDPYYWDAEQGANRFISYDEWMQANTGYAVVVTGFRLRRN